jgi:hypothetical protein
MLNLQRWQTYVIIAIVALSCLFALPNVLPASVLDAAALVRLAINLGLDCAAVRISCSSRSAQRLNERLNNLPIRCAESCARIRSVFVR